MFHFYATLAQDHGKATWGFDHALQLLKILALRIAKKSILCVAPPRSAQVVVEAGKKSTADMLTPAVGKRTDKPRLMPKLDQSEKGCYVLRRAVEIGFDNKIMKVSRRA